MASGSFTTSLHSFPAPSILYKKNDFSWERGKDSYPTSLFKSSQPIQRMGYTCQLENSRTAWRSSKALLGEGQPSEEDDGEEDSSMKNSSDDVSADLFRKRLEKIVGDDDATFSGKELATLIRNKYGRSYDVQLIKKEFMGRQLLALNVMWKYREQRSFPLTEEEYLLHLDDVANNLRCWGAVSYIRNSLAKTKERPRIGKAVSIFIDLDESGGRANEWIYR